MDSVCEVCGDVGWKDLSLHCNKCENATRHRYCFETVIYDECLEEWICDDCLPKCNEVVDLLDMSNQRKSSQIQKEINVKKLELTKGLWSWGHRRNRSFKAKRDGSAASTKHFMSGNTFNSSEMFSGEMSKLNDSEKGGSDENEHSSHSALNYTSKSDKHINIQNPMGSSRHDLNSVKGSDLSKEKDGCFYSSDYVEGSTTQGKGELFSLVDDAERANRMIEDGSSPTSTSVEQMQVFKPSSLDRSFVDKSISNSQNMYLMLNERSCPSKPMGNCAKQVVTKVDQLESSREFNWTSSTPFLEVSSKTNEVHEATAAEDQCSGDAQSFKNGKPKKRRRLILTCDEDEDAEAIQADDVDRESCENDGSKKHEEIVAVCAGRNAGCGSHVALETIAAKGHCGLSRAPLIPKYFCVQPIDKPNWTGIMKIGSNYIPVGSHLSNKACKKVYELSCSLPQIMKVEELPMSKAWPRSREASVPTAESIGLFFFSSMRSNKEFDDLVKHVIDSGIVLITVVSFAKLLIFSSAVLPAEFQVFQGKHYLWGLFQRRKDMVKRIALVEKTSMTRLMDEEKVQEQHALDKQDIVQPEALDQEMPFVKDVIESRQSTVAKCKPKGRKGGLI